LGIVVLESSRDVDSSEATAKFCGDVMMRLDNGSGNDDVNLASNENSFKGEFQILSLPVCTKLPAE
jgi:hypothetical protein